MTCWSTVPKLSVPTSQSGGLLRPGYSSLPLALPLTNAARVRNGSSMTALPVPGQADRRLHLNEQQAGGLPKRTRCRGGFRELSTGSGNGSRQQDRRVCESMRPPLYATVFSQRPTANSAPNSSLWLPRTNVADETGGGETRGVNLRGHLQSKDDHFNSLLTMRTGRLAESFL